VTTRQQALEVLLQHIAVKWSKLTPDRIAAVKQMCLASLREWLTPDDPQFIKLKLSSLTAEVAKREWPQRWVVSAAWCAS
jgi:hypothetical protein